MRRLMKLALGAGACGGALRGRCLAAAMAEMGPAILVLAGKVTELTFEGREATAKTALSTKSKEFTGDRPDGDAQRLHRTRKKRKRH